MKKWIYVLLVSLSFVLYGNSIFNDYSLDDENIKGENVQQGISGIPNIITSRYGVRDKVALDYRPIILVSYALEYQFFKQSPHVSHFINVVLYALCLIVLYQVLISVFSLQKTHAWLPLMITIFYAIHPIHTEVVNSLKNRDELFSFLFGMLFLKYGYLYFLKDEKKIKFASLAFLFLMLTLTSKLVGILYLPVLVLMLIFNKLLKWNKWNYLFLVTCFVTLFSILGFTVYGLKREFYTFENSLVGEKNFAVIIPTVLKTIFYHIKMLVLPYPLRFYYGFNLFPIKSTFEPIVLFSFIFHVGFLIFGINRFRKNDILGLLILLYLGCMFLYANYPIPYVGMFSERALFLSSVWFISVVVISVFRLLNRWQNKTLNFVVLVLSIFAFIAYSYQTIRRNFYWKNSLSLFAHDIKDLENSVNANYLYAGTLNSESYTTKDSTYSLELATKAAKHYQQAINLYPYYPEYFFQLARINRYKLRDINKAEKLFKNMLMVDTNYTGANYELGKIYFEKGDFKNSYPLFKKAYNSNPKDSLILFYYGQNSLNIGDFNTCYKVNTEFLKFYPESQYPYLNLGIYYSTILKDDSAIIYLQKAVDLGYRNKQLLTEMAKYYRKNNLMEKEKELSKLLEKNIK